MFERYTEKARRVVFFARYEASQFGSPYIETEHLLLGLLREDKALMYRMVGPHEALGEVRKDIEARTLVRDKVSTSVDLPLSNESKRVLAYAAEESERAALKHIGTEHLLLGLLREEKSFAEQLLNARGVTLVTVRGELKGLGENLQQHAPERIAERIPGPVQFIGPQGEQVALVAPSRLPVVPRTGEFVTLEVEGKQRRFQVWRVEYDYRHAEGWSALKWLAGVRVFLTDVTDVEESKL